MTANKSDIDMTPEQALELILDPSRHQEILGEQLDSFMFLAISLYGVTGSAELIPAISLLYERFLAETDTRDRMRLYENIEQKIQQEECQPEVLFPFLMSDSDRNIASRAALDYIMFSSPEPDNPLASVDRVISMANNAENPGAVLAGLLISGDRRVCDRLAPLRALLAGSAISEMVRTQSGFIYAGVVDFFIEWLQELNQPATQDDFGTVAAALVNMVRLDRSGVVVDVRRNFGLAGEGPPIEFLAQETIEEFLVSLEPRLIAINEDEMGEQIIPVVIKAWRDACRAN